MEYVKSLRARPIAIETAKANTQHYEVGTGVLQACLGPRMKYSGCLYPTGQETLGQAEIEMLESYVDKAELANGQRILDLGCAESSTTLRKPASIADVYVPCVKMWVGLRSTVLRRNLSQSTDHGLLEFEVSETVH